MDERYKRILGLGKYRPRTQYVCFLPWVSEFGWYIMNHVKRVHAFSHNRKIVCVKPGHECLFPTAKNFFYDWKDTIPDSNKGGVVKDPKIGEVKRKIIKKFGSNVTFIDPSDTSWEEKTSLAHHTFVPKPYRDNKFDVDVVVTPRYRIVERTRNYTYHWQGIVDGLLERGLRVAVCGSKEFSLHIDRAHYYAWDYVDVDADVELILNSKVVIGQESGLAYLTMMCKKPLIVIDKCCRGVMDKHRDHSVYFKEIPGAWNHLDQLYSEIEKLVLK